MSAFLSQGRDLLRKFGVQVESRPQDFGYRLLQAVSQGQNGVARRVIEEVAALPSDEAKRHALEYQDSNGQTALVLAIQRKNSLIAKARYERCTNAPRPHRYRKSLFEDGMDAAQLINAGANVNHIYRSRNTGSPLHEAASSMQLDMVHFLMEKNANPFVENSEGYTALDVALRRSDVRMVRMMESKALYRGWMSAQMPKLLGSKWVLRYIVILTRYPSPLLPPNEHIIRTHMCVYESGEAPRPDAVMWLDGAAARAPADFGRSGGEIVLQLHRTHQKPSGPLIVQSGPSRGGYCLVFKPYTLADDSITFVRQFVEAVNNRTPQHQAQQQPARSQASAPRHPTMAQAAASSALWQQSIQENVMEMPRPSHTVNSVSDVEFARHVAEHEGPLAQQAKMLSVIKSSQSMKSMTRPWVAGQQPDGPDREATARTEGASSSGAGGRQLDKQASIPNKDTYPDVEPVKGLHSGSQQQASEQQLQQQATECILCQDAPATFGFMHDDSIHMGLCDQCVNTYRNGKYQCPLCRKPIERLVRVYN